MFVLSLKQATTLLKSGELMNHIPLPVTSYPKLKADFQCAKHLGNIEELDISSAQGVIVKCQYRMDGLLAAAYILKKWEFVNSAKINNVAEEESDIEEEDFPPGEEPYHGEDEDEDDEEEGSNRIESLIYKEGKIINLPVITSAEFSSAFLNSPLHTGGIGQYHLMMGQETKSNKPYWYKGKYPLVVTENLSNHFGMGNLMESYRNAGRFIILVKEEVKNLPAFYATPLVDTMEKNMLFELNYELCLLEAPSMEYYQAVLAESARAKGYKLAKNLDQAKLIEDLKSYRGTNFDSSPDIEMMIQKAVNKKKDAAKTLNQQDFDKVFVVRELRKKSTQLKTTGAAEELDQLIGLKEAKEQLKRSVIRMKHDKLRKAAGLKTSATHLSAVFMGNPGSGKTTVARLFGKLLCEEGVLENDEFVEVSRKDLVGMFVGWTAPTVARVFERAQGGVIFIDEAYSLMSEGRNDGYSGEALAEIIRQMENNPDTLVIFAGYVDKMKDFIQNANPGLRSRLSNIIEFKDYSTIEMQEIFKFLMTQEEYRLDDEQSAMELIALFVKEITELGSENIGNGRIMRKLFKTAIGHLAERQDNDMRTIYYEDIERASNELLNAERMVSEKKKIRSIGFVM